MSQQTTPSFCPWCGAAVEQRAQTCVQCSAALDERFHGLTVVPLSTIDTRAEVKETRAHVLAALKEPQSRRKFFKGAAAVASGAALVGAGIVYGPAISKASALQTLSNTKQQQAKSSKSATASIVDILTIARTAEQLAVTFYSNGIANADKLGLKDDDLVYLKAALVEEQIHQQFFKANGGQSLTETFSFPEGAKTFSDLKTFIATQQQLEGVFDSAFLAAIKEFAQLGRPDLAQIAGQVACVEAEHRALGRVIGGLDPANNWAFTPVYLASVADAPALVTKAGYLSPKSGNSYTYKEVSTANAGVEQRKPFSASAAVVGNG